MGQQQAARPIHEWVVNQPWRLRELFMKQHSSTGVRHLSAHCREVPSKLSSPPLNVTRTPSYVWRNIFSKRKEFEVSD